jgi:hypothetical protein
LNGFGFGLDGGQDAVEKFLAGKGVGEQLGMGQDHIRLEKDLALGADSQFFHAFLDDAGNPDGIVFTATSDQDFVLHGPSLIEKMKLYIFSL